MRNCFGLILITLAFWLGRTAPAQNSNSDVARYQRIEATDIELTGKLIVKGAAGRIAVISAEGVEMRTREANGPRADVVSLNHGGLHIYREVKQDADKDMEYKVEWIASLGRMGPGGPGHLSLCAPDGREKFTARAGGSKEGALLTLRDFAGKAHVHVGFPELLGRRKVTPLVRVVDSSGHATVELPSPE